jgi:hypothetical protein
MATNTNQFLVSVCDVVVRDTIADAVVMKGKALINSAFKQSLATTEVRGGDGNPIQYIYNHDKKLDISVESCTFDESFIALNNGTSIISAAKDYYVIDESVTLVAGAGTTAHTPVGSVYVQKVDNSIVTVTPTGSNFTVSGGAATTVLVTYRTSATVDSINIDASSSPNSYELTMSSKIFQGTGQTGVLQIILPKWKPTGNFDLSFSAGGVSTNKMDGMALVEQATNSYATVLIIPVGSSVISYSAIAATPSAVSVSSGSPTAQLSVYGLRGGLYSNVLVTSGCTFVSGTPATCTVSTGGLITRVATGSSVITVTHTASGLTDTVTVTSA